jgi:exo-1,4-beta-D-glucosaminidase
MNRFAMICLAAICALSVPLHADNRIVLQDGWQLQTSAVDKAGGAAISSPSHPTTHWLRTQVPGTVLAAQVAAGVFPDPYFGDNLRRIPGAVLPPPGGEIFANLPMPPDSPYRGGWWYRKEFEAPAATSQETHYWLHFGGINYRAELWLNGHRFADSTQVAGAYRTYDFDVTPLIQPGRINVLAVETFAPGEKSLGINWVDWNPTPPDKDMGLWGEVALEVHGPITLRAPMAATHFTGGDLQTAALTVYAEIHNSARHPVAGILSGTAAGVHFERKLEVAPGENRTLSFTAQEFPQLLLRHPQLWWPHAMGEAHLEKLTLRFTSAEAPAEELSTEFGIREVTSELTTNGSRLFRVNGKPILIRGGGWSQDMLLRRNENRLRQQILMVRDLNLNTIRLEGKMESEEFFRLTDREGLLVMAGWCCCDHWEHWKNWSDEDLSIARESLRAQMLRLRHHASLLVWLNGSDGPPPANVESAYLQVEAETHWPNPVLSSASAAPTSVSGASGVKMSGPYDYVAPSYWYVDSQHGGAFGFNTETSPGPAIPSLASRRRFLPDPEAWPPSANWNFHNGGGEFSSRAVFDEAMKSVYAQPQSAAEYERLAQTMAYDAERAMFEAYSRNKYASTGVVQWMLNNAWPSMIWHLYDDALDAGGGYFGVKKACEPLHIQYSWDDHSIVVVNSTYQAVSGLHASLRILSTDGKELLSQLLPANAPPDSSQRIFTLPDSLYSNPLFFADLLLQDATGHTVSRNFYWIPTPLTTFDWPRTRFTHTPALHHEDLSALQSLPRTTVYAQAEIVEHDKIRELHLHLRNTNALAFQLHAAVQTQDGALVAPVFWNDNWIELNPGESRILTAQLPADAPLEPLVVVDGWNFQPKRMLASAKNSRSVMKSWPDKPEFENTAFAPQTATPPAGAKN